MEDVLDAARAQPRFVMFLLGVFSAMALLLALVGIYGVIVLFGGTADAGIGNSHGAGRHRRRRIEVGDRPGIAPRHRWRVGRR
jgi:hypothetical protein